MFNFQDPHCDFKALETLDPSLIQLEEVRKPEMTASNPCPRNALVTGATGFTGAHLVAHLAKSDDWKKVFVLIREDNPLMATQRLKTAWDQWRINVSPEAFHKVEVYNWEPMKHRMGLSPQLFSTLTWHTDVIYHMANSVDFDKDYKHVRASTSLLMLQLLDLASEGLQSQLHHIGTIADRVMNTVRHKERRIEWTSGHFQAKWVVDKMLQRAREDFDICAVNYRAPHVTGSTDIAADPGLAYPFWRMAVACARAGLIWDGYFPQAVPVDLLCLCLDMNARRKDPLPVVTPTMLPLHTGRVAETLNCELVDAEEFFRHVAPHTDRQACLREVTYRDIEVASTDHGDLDRFISVDAVPDAAEMFRRGFRQEEIQKLLQ